MCRRCCAPRNKVTRKPPPSYSDVFRRPSDSGSSCTLSCTARSSRFAVTAYRSSPHAPEDIVALSLGRLGLAVLVDEPLQAARHVTRLLFLLQISRNRRLIGRIELGRSISLANSDALASNADIPNRRAEPIALVTEIWRSWPRHQSVICSSAPTGLSSSGTSAMTIEVPLGRFTWICFAPILRDVRHLLKLSFPYICRSSAHNFV